MSTGQLGLNFDAAPAATPPAAPIAAPIVASTPPGDPPSSDGVLTRWAVVTGPWVPELPPGVMPEILLARDAAEAVAISAARHNDGLERWAMPVVSDAEEEEAAASEPAPLFSSPAAEAEFNRRVSEIFEEGRAARAGTGNAHADEEPAPARWQRPRGPVRVGGDELEDPGVIAAQMLEDFQEATLAIAGLALELESPGRPAPAPAPAGNKLGEINRQIQEDLQDAMLSADAASAPAAPPKLLSKAEKLAAAQEAELRSPLEIAIGIRARDLEIERAHDGLIKMLIPEGTKLPALPELTACVVDGVAMLACAAGTVRLDLVLERLARTDSTGFVLLEDIAGEIARSEPLPTSMAGEIGDLMVATMTRSLKRGELENKNLERIMASVLGCTLEELPGRLADDKAKEAARRAEEKTKWEEKRTVTADPLGVEGGGPRPGGRARKQRAPAPPVDIQAAAQRRLTPRQIELVRMVNVVDDRAIYGDGTEEHIPDWANLKKTMVALGGAWKPASRKGPAGFRFADGVDIAETIRLAQDTGEIYDATAVGFYPTPEELARATAARLGIQPGWRVLEPSAGSGRLAIAARNLGATVSCIEPLAKNREALAALGFDLVGEDFLIMDPLAIEPFDGLLQNPPFANDADAEHALHATRFVLPGGPVVSIASAGIIEHTTGLGPVLRAFLAAHGGTIERLPEGSFLESGTGVRTCVVAFKACAGCRSQACRSGRGG